jgi:hypothetical protein
MSHSWQLPRQMPRGPHWRTRSALFCGMPRASRSRLWPKRPSEKAIPPRSNIHGILVLSANGRGGDSEHAPNHPPSIRISVGVLRPVALCFDLRSLLVPASEPPLAPIRLLRSGSDVTRGGLAFSNHQAQAWPVPGMPAGDCRVIRKVIAAYARTCDTRLDKRAQERVTMRRTSAPDLSRDGPRSRAGMSAASPKESGRAGPW